MNHKRSVTAIIVILLAMILLGVSNNRIKEVEELKEPKIYGYSLGVPVKKNEIKYVSMELGKDYMGGYYVKYNDKVEKLFDKFEVRYEYRDFIRSVCIAANVDPLIAISVGQIESHSGTHPDYNNRTEERSYWIKGVKCWDDGWFQLNSYYHDYFEENFFNPELLQSLGYFREFRPNDDYVSIQTGIYYLSYLKNYYGNYEDAVASYNAGFKRVAENNLLPSTVKYVKAIMNNQRYIEDV